MFQLITEQDDFIVVDKAANSSFHSEAGQAGLFETIKQQKKLAELYPVHRLDKMTSGVLLLAKNKTAATALGDQFEQRQVDKYYLAISDKKPKKKQGLIKGDMTTARRGSYKLKSSMSNPAVTQFFSQSIGAGQRAYLLKPRTGKTHQLRVAMKSIGAPISGDQRYYPECPDMDRGYLHAFQLTFALAGQTYQFQCLPQHGELFQNTALSHLLAEQWAKPEQLPWPTL